FHQLAVARVELPPLRRRRGDVAVLAQHFWSAMGGDAAGPPPDAVRRFDDEPWPGNVRELRNAVARLIALGSLADRPPTFDDDAPPPSAARDVVEAVLRMNLPLSQARQRVVDHFERRYVERVLAQHDGNVVRAAAASGVARRYFQILRAKQGRGAPE
ncbi:MAG TPA: Fis family transcriptional regulator, partial [Minicystis sp.]|nr:Fis family transcriptional regulator [Minicystis sp.]